MKIQVDCGVNVNVRQQKYLENIKLQEVTKKLLLWNGIQVAFAQSAGAVEYIDSTSANG